jgi:hypothetical protein
MAGPLKPRWVNSIASLKDFPANDTMTSSDTPPKVLGFIETGECDKLIPS